MQDTYAMTRTLTARMDGQERPIGALHAHVEPGRMGSMSVEIYDADAWAQNAQAAAEAMEIFRELAIAFAAEHGGVLI